MRYAHPLREVQALVPFVLPPLDDLFTRRSVNIVALTVGQTGLAASTAIWAPNEPPKPFTSSAAQDLAQRRR